MFINSNIDNDVANNKHPNYRTKLDCRHCLLPYAGTTGTRTGGAVAPNPSLDKPIHFHLYLCILCCTSGIIFGTRARICGTSSARFGTRGILVPVISLQACDLAPLVPKWMIPTSRLAPEQARVSKNGTVVPTCRTMDVRFVIRSGTKHRVVQIASGVGTIAVNDRRARNRTGPMTLRHVCQSSYRY